MSIPFQLLAGFFIRFFILCCNVMLKEAVNDCFPSLLDIYFSHPSTMSEMQHKAKKRKDISIKFCNLVLLLTSHLPQIQILLFLEPHIAGAEIANWMKKGKWEERYFGILPTGNSPATDRYQEDPGEGAINLDRHPNSDYLGKP